MTLEVVNTIASIGTLLVIAATAIAALGQLRHMRGNNQIVALTECREVLESEGFMRALRFVVRELHEHVKDPKTRAALMQAPLGEELRAVNVVGNFFESMGSFVKHDIIDEDIAMDLWSGIVVQAWEHLVPALSVMRRTAGIGLWENFEYLAAISKAYAASHPSGTYPSDKPRLKVEDAWVTEDKTLGIYRSG